MGRIAELIEKKAQGKLTEEEKKELDQLLAESKAVEEPSETEDPEEDVEKEAQKLADAVTSKFSSVEDKMNEVLKKLDEKKPDIQVTDKSEGFIFDKSLGKKVTVAELSEKKITLSNRKSQNKQNFEISERSVYFLNALVEKNVEKLQILSEGTAADGGYLVPEDFANMIVEDVRDLTVMRKLASQMTTQVDTVHLPSLASRPQANWRAEKAVKQTSTVNWSEQVFTPYSLASIVPLSNELAADAKLGVNGSIVNYIAGVMSTALAEKEEQAFWVGDGSGKPTGINNYSLRNVAVSGSTDSSNADAIIAAVWRTPQGYRDRGAFVANAATLERIAKLKDTTGQYLLTPLGSSSTFTFRGRPVYEQNDLPGGIAFYGDFSYYMIVDREGISVRVSDEATVAGSSAFEKNLTFVRVEKRVDAELTLTNAVTKITGLGSA